MSKTTVGTVIVLLVLVSATLLSPAGDIALGGGTTSTNWDARAPTPAQLYTEITKVAPADPRVGQAVTITALVFNTGDAAGKKDIVFKLDGAVKETKKDVSLDPKKGIEISFTFTPTEAKTYAADIDGQKFGVTVVAASPPPAPAPPPAAPAAPATPPKPSPAPAPAPPAAAGLTTGPLTIAPAQVKTGEKVTITATITNGGDSLLKKTVILKVNDKPVETRDVSVDAKKSTTISFTVTQTQPGSYTVDVDGQTGKFTVAGSGVPTPPPPPSSSRGPGDLDWWMWLVIGVAVGAVGVLLLQRARSPY